MSDLSSFKIFPWNENFETGLYIIDQQHQKLVDIINLLADHLAHCSAANILEQIFTELADYAVYHFETEETIWRKYLADDDWMANHEKTHVSFLEQVVALKNNEEKLSLDEVIQKVLSFLTQWLAAHILESDKRFALVVLNVEAGHSVETAKERATQEMSGATKLLIKTVLTMYDHISARSMDLMREKALRQQAEQKLLESEERWKFLLESHEDSVWDWNIEQDNFTLAVSDTPLFDIASNAFFPTDHQYKIHLSDIERMKKDLRDHLDGKTDFYINKHRVLCDNGSWKWMLSKGKVISRTEDGNALRMIGVHIDITEKELAIQIYHSSIQAMFVADVNLQIIAINPAFKKITGLNENDVMGKNPDILFSASSDEKFVAMRNSIQKKESWCGEVCGHKKNGEEYCIEMNINAMTSKGVIEQYIGLFSDITEKKRNELALAQKEREKRLIFNATVHSTQHILNNLLNHMMYFKMKAEHGEPLDANEMILYKESIKQGTELVKKLSAVEELTEESIKASVYPK